MRLAAAAAALQASTGASVARPIWNGTISFGLLNVPVQLHAGERSVDLHFRLLDSRDRRPIRYERINSESGEEVAWKDIVKAFEYTKGNYVVVPEKELRAASPEATETIQIEAFVDREAVSPVYFEKPYYLTPRPKAEKGYVLLRETLQRAHRIGIGKVVIRTRQYLAALMAQGPALLLDLMRFPQELVPADEFELPTEPLSAYHLSQRELDMAKQLIDAMSTEWRPGDYRDDFRDQLRRFIEQRVAAERGTKPPPGAAAPAAHASTNVVDFMALLKKSLESQGQRGPHAKRTGATGAGRARPRPAARKSSSHGRRTH
jgi:DNA end-binding protein Ku